MPFCSVFRPRLCTTWALERMSAMVAAYTPVNRPCHCRRDCLPSVKLSAVSATKTGQPQIGKTLSAFYFLRAVAVLIYWWVIRDTYCGLTQTETK
eukprot:4158062-Amphidinium_carterae.1